MSEQLKINLIQIAFVVGIPVFLGTLFYVWSKIGCKKYYCTHPENHGSPIIVSAKNKDAAFSKCRSIIQGRMFGEWALTYNPEALDRVMKDVHIEQEED